MHFPSLQEIALRNRGIYIGKFSSDDSGYYSSLASSIICVHFLRLCGYTLSEEAYRALTTASDADREELMACFKDIYGLRLNWAALVRCWGDAVEITDEQRLIAYLVNLYDLGKHLEGTQLGCGHFIPKDTFPLERYTGCPICGTPMETADYTNMGQGDTIPERILKAYTDKDMQAMLTNLLAATAPLDATQANTLSGLLRSIPIELPQQIEIKETAIVVIDYLVEVGRSAEAIRYIHSPKDILRYLWYKQTGLLQIIEPNTLIKHRIKQQHYSTWFKTEQEQYERNERQKLRLKYTRNICRAVAEWLNKLEQPAQVLVEQMHSKRGMWVRFIRALRLAEYARRRGFERLATLLDIFYRQDYSVYQAELDKARAEQDLPSVAALLSQRPGLFARQLFSTMLAFGADAVLAYFAELAKDLPARLLLSLYNGSMLYFDTEVERFAKPITGGMRRIQPNKYLDRYTKEELIAMQDALREMLLNELSRRYRLMLKSKSVRSVYIDPKLHDTPLPVGERSTTMQGVGYALQGTRFAVEGDALRLFLQWGEGLTAQHLDMDLSCRLALQDGTIDECAYYSLNVQGATHSGDIRYIPDMVGTAEYIELDLPILEERGVRYAVFTCNAYSAGALSPKLMFGWMHSKYPMHISEIDGVAYDPSCVAHLCRVGDEGLHKGLVFGVLDVVQREVIWLETPLSGQTLRSANQTAIETLLKRLGRKLRIGELLALRAQVQGLVLVTNPEEADLIYTYDWALQSGEVYQQLIL